METTNTNLAVREKTLPAALDFVADDAGRGLQEVAIDDQAIPFLKILQDISKEAKKKNDAYIDGAEPGMILDDVSKALYSGDEGVLVAPVYVEPAWVEWFIPEGGGTGQFRGKHPNDTPLLEHCEKGPKGENFLPSGNQLVRTFYVYCLLIHEDGMFDQVVISMARSQLKKAKAWNRQMKSTVLKKSDGTPFVAPSFLFTYRLRTVVETSSKGDDYHNWTISQDEMLANTRIYNLARQFAGAAESGDVKTQDERTEGEHGGQSEKDESIPF